MATSEKEERNTSLRQLILHADVEAIQAALRDGADPNERSSSLDELPLTLAIEEIDVLPLRHRVLETLLRGGANPRLLDDEDERFGPLFAAVLAEDAEALRLLLKHGADLDAEFHVADDSETLYAYAEERYRFRRDWFSSFPRPPTELEQSNEFEWVRFLRSLADSTGESPPDYLEVLLEFGAKRRRGERNATGPMSPD